MNRLQAAYPTASDVVDIFADWELSAEQRSYLVFHAERYAFTLALLRRLGVGQRSRLLDIGPSFQTHLFRTMLGADVAAMGNGPAGAQRDFQCDIRCDLNTGVCDSAPAGTFDFISVLEVIEHLHVSPVRALTFLARFLAPDGVLVVQTPNAVSLPKRLAMLRGRNPFELLRDSEHNVGHIREYTLAEIRDMGEAASLAYMEQHVLDYWPLNGEGIKAALYRASLPMLWATLRAGITMVFRLDSGRSSD